VWNRGSQPHEIIAHSRVLVGDESCRAAVVTDTTRPPNAVHIVLNLVWHIVIYYHHDVWHVKPPGANICGHENVLSPRPEILERILPLRLSVVPVDGRCKTSFPSEQLLEKTSLVKSSEISGFTRVIVFDCVGLSKRIPFHRDCAQSHLEWLAEVDVKRGCRFEVQFASRFGGGHFFEVFFTSLLVATNTSTRCPSRFWLNNRSTRIFALLHRKFVQNLTRPVSMVNNLLLAHSTQYSRHDQNLVRRASTSTKKDALTCHPGPLNTTLSAGSCQSQLQPRRPSR